MTSNPKWKSKNTTGQPTGFWAGWRRKGSKSEHNINQTEVSEYSTQNGLYPTCAPNTVMLFSIQFICCRQFNLILILLVLRLFQSFLSTLLCRIYKWNIQTLFGFFLLFLLSRTESFCLIIFLYIVMFYQDHRKYYKGCYGKLKKQLPPISGRTVLHTLCFMLIQLWLIVTIIFNRNVNQTVFLSINTLSDKCYLARLKN